MPAVSWNATLRGTVTKPADKNLQEEIVGTESKCGMLGCSKYITRYDRDACRLKDGNWRRKRLRTRGRGWR